MQNLKETIKTEDIDTNTMYKMIYSLLDYNFYYEAKCLVITFIEERKIEKELEVLNTIQNLLSKYTYCTNIKEDKNVYLEEAMNLLRNNIDKLELQNKKKSIIERIIDKLF